MEQLLIVLMGLWMGLTVIVCCSGVVWLLFIYTPYIVYKNRNNLSIPLSNETLVWLSFLLIYIGVWFVV
tara:strand:+ start:226 stop:432 length:207 start_codon:yes stop_codon:yes gene_type:complete